MTDFVLLKSIFRTIFSIIQSKIHKVNLILADGISAFHSSEIVNVGGVTGDTGGGNDVGGCDGKLISDPPFARGDIE